MLICQALGDTSGVLAVLGLGGQGSTRDLLPRGGKAEENRR